MNERALVAWFKGRPKWVQEAANRLFVKDAIEGQDIIELAELCKKEAVGELDASEYTLPDLALGVTSTNRLRLCSIDKVQGINALAPKKPLDFGPGNLAIVYGQNGSGKSGYVRILKHACGARFSGALHPNVYSSEPSPQRCSISYEHDGTQVNVDWKVETGVIDDLRGVDIFDAHCGRVYITEENEVTYEPPVLSFFSELIDVCEKVSGILNTEKSKLISKKPTLPEEYNSTSAGQWYAKLSSKVTSEDIIKYCTWTETHESKLKDLQNRLAEPDPAEKAKQLRSQKQHSETLIRNAETLLKQLSDENCRRIIALKKKAVLKKKAAIIAAKQVFNETPLDGIGSEVWRQLWEQARKYSQEEAYKDIEFPFTGDDARCVLCQQPLSDDAKKRMQSFEEFIKGETQKEAKAALNEFDDAVGNIDELPTAESLKTKADAGGLDTGYYEQLETIYAALRARKKELPTVDSAENLTPLPKSDEWIAKVKNKIASYEESAKKYKEDAQKGNYTQLKEKLIELQAKKWISLQHKLIEDEIDRLKTIDNLDAGIKLTNTKGLSQKKGELAEALVTDAFVSRFNDELKRLGADRIKIELIKTRVEKGRVLHRLQLQNANGVSLDDILSEGEYRIVSLAAFLADVGGKDFSAPFLFDDPISSLDQNFEETVVQRLVELSQARQVIIFTHRLSLLGLMQDYAKKAEVEPYVICVRQEPWGTGEPGETPIFAKKPEKALNKLLDERLAQARKSLHKHGQEFYEPMAKSICSDYRILLERMIESELLADVVHRYRRAVNTMGKIKKLSRITESDCEFFDRMMTKYSRYEHSQPIEAPVPLPDPDELEKDLKKLKAWHKEFRSREAK